MILIKYSIAYLLFFFYFVLLKKEQLFNWNVYDILFFFFECLIFSHINNTTFFLSIGFFLVRVLLEKGITYFKKEPSILIQNGILNFHVFRSSHLSIQSFLSNLNHYGIKDLSEVSKATLKGKHLVIQKNKE